MDSVLNNVVLQQEVYQNQICKIKRLNSGIFLTSDIAVIDNIINIIDLDNILSKSILEPSVGNGIILLRLIQNTAKVYDHLAVYELINNCLFFSDIDDAMIEKTKTNIRKLYFDLFKIEYTGRFNSFVCDYSNIEEVHKQMSFLKERVDYIIGNPPYITLYGRRDKKQSEEQRQYFLNNYSQFPATLKNGKLNYIMFFIEQSINMVKTNGIISFIIDLTFFETAFKYTRKYLLEQSNVLEILYNIKSFRDVGSGQVIIKLQKAKFLNNLSTTKLIDLQGNITKEIITKNWYNPEDEFRFRFTSCNRSDSIIKSIKNKCRTLKDQHQNKALRTSTMLLDMEDLFVSINNHEYDVPTFKYYKGSKSLPIKYKRLESSLYFFYNKPLQDRINEELKEELTKQGIKNKKRIGLGDINVFNNPKIYIRQSAKEIIASYDESASAANNSLYVFSLGNNTDFTKKYLKFLCGYLNSNLVTFYAQITEVIRYKKGKQPQIKVSDLYNLPVPRNEELENSISHMVNILYYTDTCERNELISEINTLVYKHYNISNDDILFIEKYIQNYLSS